MNQVTLRQSVRKRLEDISESDTLAADCTSTATTLTVTTISKYRVNGQIQIGTEIIKVTAIDTTNSQITVTRGWEFTTAAVHSNTNPITIYDKFNDTFIDEGVVQGIKFLKPANWILTENTSLQTAADTYEYLLPAGVTIENLWEVFMQDANNKMQPCKGWYVAGNYLMFEDIPYASGKTIKLIYMGYPGFDGVGTYAGSEEGNEAVINFACKYVLERWLATRSHYLEYAASVNERASTPDELIRVQFYYYNQALVEKERIWRPKPWRRRQRLRYL